MRIAYFDFVVHFGGAQKATVQMAERLARHHEVHMIDAFGTSALYHAALRRSNLPTHVLAPEVPRPYVGMRHSRIRRMAGFARHAVDMLAVQRRLAALARRIGLDLVWTNGIKGLLQFGPSTRLQDLIVAYYMHGEYAPRMVTPLARWLLSRRTDVLMAVSTATAANVRRAGVSGPEVRVVYNPIDVAAMLGRSGQLSGGELPQQGRRPWILMPATLLPGKGQTHAIKAMACLAAQRMGGTLWLAGDATTPEARTYVRTLREQMALLGLTDSVFFLGWRADLPAVMARADIVILPSLTEGLPLAIMESLALAKPVVASDVGGIGDLVLHEQTGLLVPPGDPEALAGAIARMAGDPVVAGRMALAGQKRMQTVFSPDRHTQRMLEAFDAAAGHRRRRKGR